MKDRFKKIDFKQIKYTAPLLVLPLLIVFFWIYKDFTKETNVVTNETSVDLNTKLPEASQLAIENGMNDKLDAYDKHYNDFDKGITAIDEIEKEEEEIISFENLYDEEEQMRLDSISASLKAMQDSIQRAKENSTNLAQTSLDQEAENKNKLLEYLNSRDSIVANAGNESEEDYKKEMMFFDSIQKANNPEYQEKLEQEKFLKEKQEKIEYEKLSSLKVSKNKPSRHFNSISTQSNNEFIKAIIDENRKGYAGSRIRLKLLDDIYVGNQLIKKGTFIFSEIVGFNSERVMLNITSILYENEILPIQLTVYDTDGMKGLYVPNSAFREFSKELGSESVNGIDMSQMSSTQQQDLLTNIGTSAFKSATDAISKFIRKNSVKLKYSTYIYLIDEETLREKRDEIYQENTNNKN